MEAAGPPIHGGFLELSACPLWTPPALLVHVKFLWNVILGVGQALLPEAQRMALFSVAALCPVCYAPVLSMNTEPELQGTMEVCTVSIANVTLLSLGSRSLRVRW